MRHYGSIKKVFTIIFILTSLLSAEGLTLSSIDLDQLKGESGSILHDKIYYGGHSRKSSLWEDIDCYLQPQVGLGYNVTSNEKSIIMLGAYVALELKNFRLGFSGNIGSSFSYYGVQVEKLIPIVKDKHFITLRLGNFGRKSSNAGVFYEAQIENISALLGVEFATDDIISFNSYNYAFTIGMGIILDDMNY